MQTDYAHTQLPMPVSQESSEIVNEMANLLGALEGILDLQ